MEQEAIEGNRRNNQKEQWVTRRNCGKTRRREDERVEFIGFECGVYPSSCTQIFVKSEGCEIGCIEPSGRL